MEPERNPAARTECLGGGRFVYVSDGCTFGADALLLAAFSRPPAWGTVRDRERICDLGTGSGILPLPWHTVPRHPDAPPIDAVELDAQAAALAARSRSENGLTGRIQVIQADWSRLAPLLEAGRYDRVTCNPPYFAAGTGRKSHSPERLLARHESPTGLRDLCESAARLLKNGGRFCLCHRPERLADVLSVLRQARLEPKRLGFAHHTPGSAPFLFLCEARKNGRPGLDVLPPLFSADIDFVKEAAACPAP